MPNDFFTLNALCYELNDTLQSGKIDKIHMPESDEINFYIRRGGNNYILAISANAQNPRLHITKTKKQNPITAPGFCMHLRKYLSGGVINKISLIGDDRIFCFSITSRNELRDEVEYRLIAEMMGRYSNILLLDDKGKIKDTLKQASYDTATKRCLLPSVNYELPVQSKIPCTDSQALYQKLLSYSGTDVSGFIMGAISGFALSTAKECLNICDIDNNACSINEQDAKKICDTIKFMLDINKSDKYKPCVSIKNDVPDDYFIFPYSSTGLLFECKNNLNEAIDDCIGRKDLSQRRIEHTKYLQKAYKGLLGKTKKRLEKCLSRKSEASDLEKNKKYGELITSYMYMIKKGDKFACVQDYYQEDMPTVQIPLDEKLSPQQNAQQYFKKYAKQKRTLEVVEKQIEECQNDLYYLYTIQPSIDLCSTDNEIAEVEAELTEIGALKQNKKRNKQKTKPAQPVFYDVNGFTVAVGKNNIQNDKLTFKVANGGDLWIHTKDVHGSHTIVFAEGRQIPDDVIQTACEIAVFYSQAKPGVKVSCDYTKRKNLKRHPSGKPGMVLYTTYNTAYVQADEHKEFLAKD